MLYEVITQLRRTSHSRVAVRTRTIRPVTAEQFTEARVQPGPIDQTVRGRRVRISVVDISYNFV